MARGAGFALDFGFGFGFAFTLDGFGFGADFGSETDLLDMPTE